MKMTKPIFIVYLFGGYFFGLAQGYSLNDNSMWKGLLFIGLLLWMLGLILEKKDKE